MSKFVHLHLHTEYSLLDGAVRLDRVSGKNKEGEKIHSFPLKGALLKDGQDAVAITDHGNMYGVYTFVKTLKGSGIKPIIGCEFYVAPNMYDKRAEVMKCRDHLVLLAKNEQGYKNLMILDSKAFVDGFYQKPRIDLNLLSQYSEGLICCSACLAGRIPRYLLANEYDEAKVYALKLKSIFDEGDFYIELQDHGLEGEKYILPQLVRLAKEIGVKVVATNDVHYINREDADIQDTMMCVQMQCKKNDVVNARFENDNFYLKSQEEMISLFDWCPEAIESTIEIANKCNFEFVLSRKSIIPKYHNDEMGDRDENQYLRDLTYERIHRRYDTITDEMKNRLEYELSAIIDCGYAGYFLIVWDFVNTAKERGIPVGPGRGSGVGSLVAYSIGITDVDPLKYNLIFERFLSKERVSMPDFDIDFCYNRRGEVIDYVTEKYGKDNVSQIIAYSTMSAKAAIKDVARVYDVSFQDANNWVKDLPKMGKPFIGESLGEWGKEVIPEFKLLYETNPEAKKVIDVAKNLEGMPRQVSMHAAGVVICPDPIVQHVPLQRNGDDITTQFDKDQIEKLGLLKMDFLALKTLTDISEAEKYILADKGVKVDFNKLGYDDPEVYKLIASGDCEGVFQLEGGGMKNFMSKLKPDNLEEVIAGISIYRPGPMQFMDDYINGKREPEKIKYAHPILKNILGVTYGCIVYQEQVMQIAKDLAGFSFGGADIMRRAISKKKLEVLNENKEIFINGGDMKVEGGVNHVKGCVANGVPKDVAESLWKQILDFASYAFNKSHAAAYAHVSYQTAYLKRYYPLHYIMAVANDRISSADEVKHYVNYIKDQGYKIYSPDINKSSELFTIENDGMRYGLKGIKNMGEAAMESILKERENGEYKDIKDLVDRNPLINKRMLESLIKGGALDSFHKNRATLMASYEQIVDASALQRKSAPIGQISLFDDLLEDVPVTYTEMPEYNKAQLLQYEKEVLGMYVSGHPLDDYRNDMQGFNFSTKELMIEEEDEEAEEGVSLVPNHALDGKNVTFGGIISDFESRLSKNQKRYAIGRIEDLDGVISFAMFGSSFEKNQAMMQTETSVKIKGKLDMKNDSDPKIIINAILPWERECDKLKEENSVKQEEIKENFFQNEEKRSIKIKREILYINITEDGLLELIRSYLKRFKGDVTVIVVINQNGNKRAFELAEKVEISDEFLLRLKNMVGSKNIKVKEK